MVAIGFSGVWMLQEGLNVVSVSWGESQIWIVKTSLQECCIYESGDGLDPDSRQTWVRFQHFTSSVSLGLFELQIGKNV